RRVCARHEVLQQEHGFPGAQVAPRLPVRRRQPVRAVRGDQLRGLLRPGLQARRAAHALPPPVRRVRRVHEQPRRHLLPGEEVRETMDPRRQQSVAVALPVATRGAEVRSRFLVRTYLHLYAAIVAFTLIEAFLFVTGLARLIAIGMLSVSWLVVLGSFVIVSWFASHVAHRTTSLPAQYAALGVYVV